MKNHPRNDDDININIDNNRTKTSSTRISISSTSTSGDKSNKSNQTIAWEKGVVRYTRRLVTRKDRLTLVRRHHPLISLRKQVPHRRQELMSRITLLTKDPVGDSTVKVDLLLLVGEDGPAKCKITCAGRHDRIGSNQCAQRVV